MHLINDKITILFGSQTGTAKQEAEYLAGEFLSLTEQKAQVEVNSMDSFSFENIIDEQAIIFMISTTGVGNFPFNSSKFWNKLTLNLPENCLNDLNFVIFGFGDSSYLKYNQAAKMLNARLIQLGGQAILPLSLGNEGAENGYFEELEKWKKSLFRKLSNTEYLNGKLDKIIYKTKKSRFNKFEELKIEKPDKQFEGFVESNEIATDPSHSQEVRRLKIKVLDNFEFKCGDCLTVHFKNSEENIKKLSECIRGGLSGNVHISVEENITKVFDKFSNDSWVNLWDIMRTQLDFMRPMNFHFFKSLADFSELEIYKEKIKEMSFEDYYAYVVREYRSIWEVLFDFKIPNIPVDLILSFCPRIRPREFSIASSPSKSYRDIEIIYAIVEYKTPFKRFLTRPN